MSLSPQLLARVNGAVIHVCPNPECQKHFASAPYTGRSGKLYCSRACRSEINDEFDPFGGT
jgi:hypothetical protein